MLYIKNKGTVVINGVVSCQDDGALNIITTGIQLLCSTNCVFQENRVQDRRYGTFEVQSLYILILFI